MNKIKLPVLQFNRSFFLIIIFLFSIVNCFAQRTLPGTDFIVALDTISSNKIYYPVVHQPSITETKLSSDSSYGTAIFKFPLQPYQNIYSKYVNHKVGINEMKYAFNVTKIRRMNYDTSRLSSKPLNGAISFLIEIKKDGKIIMHPDINNDNDFTNDTSVLLGDVNEKRISKKVLSFQFSNIEMADDNKGAIMINTNVTFNINEVSDSTANALVRDLQIKNGWIKIIQNNYRIGKIRIDNLDYYMIVNAGIGRNMYDEQNSNSISFFDNLDSVTSRGIHKSEQYFIGDTILINKKYFIIKSISNYYESIHLQELSNNAKVFGYRQGFYISDFIGIKLNDDTISYNSQLKNHYVILDFWGSWCEPCMELIPEMKKEYAALQLQLADSIKFVSIAYDSKKDIDKLKKIIQQNDLNWLHLYDDRDIFMTNSLSLVKKFHISCYPGYVLISPDGKILFNGCGKEALGQIGLILKKTH